MAVVWPEAILVADDASPEADAAVDVAADLAIGTGARLSLLHVRSLSPSVPDDPSSRGRRRALDTEAEGLLTQRLARIRARGADVDRRWVRLTARIEREIVKIAEREGVDLLVVPRRRGGDAIRRTLGDLSLHLVRDAPCPVLVVPDPRVPPPRRRLAASPPHS